MPAPRPIVFNYDNAGELGIAAAAIGSSRRDREDDAIAREEAWRQQQFAQQQYQFDAQQAAAASRQQAQRSYYSPSPSRQQGSATPPSRTRFTTVYGKDQPGNIAQASATDRLMAMQQAGRDASVERGRANPDSVSTFGYTDDQGIRREIQTTNRQGTIGGRVEAPQQYDGYFPQGTRPRGTEMRDMTPEELESGGYNLAPSFSPEQGAGGGRILEDIIAREELSTDSRRMAKNLLPIFDSLSPGQKASVITQINQQNERDQKQMATETDRATRRTATDQYRKRQATAIARRTQTTRKLKQLNAEKKSVGKQISLLEETHSYLTSFSSYADYSSSRKSKRSRRSNANRVFNNYADLKSRQNEISQTITEIIDEQDSIEADVSSVESFPNGRGHSLTRDAYERAMQITGGRTDEARTLLENNGWVLGG